MLKTTKPPSLSHDKSETQMHTKRQPEGIKKFINYVVVKIPRVTVSVHMAQQCIPSYKTKAKKAMRHSS